MSGTEATKNNSTDSKPKPNPKTKVNPKSKINEKPAPTSKVTTKSKPKSISNAVKPKESPMSINPSSSTRSGPASARKGPATRVSASPSTSLHSPRSQTVSSPSLSFANTSTRLYSKATTTKSDNVAENLALLRKENSELREKLNRLQDDLEQTKALCDQLLTAAAAAAAAAATTTATTAHSTSNVPHPISVPEPSISRVPGHGACADVHVNVGARIGAGFNADINVEACADVDVNAAELRRRVLIVGDSMTRDLGSILQSLLPDFSVSCRTSPGATFEHTVEDLERLTLDFSKRVALQARSLTASSPAHTPYFQPQSSLTSSIPNPSLHDLIDLSPPVAKVTRKKPCQSLIDFFNSSDSSIIDVHDLDDDLLQAPRCSISTVPISDLSPGISSSSPSQQFSNADSRFQIPSLPVSSRPNPTNFSSKEGIRIT
ncbi:hypothetical protein M8J75_001402 [Diaphorina citri]|nr:hypothetical protein M8J75_001402 [Diaphorina citri]